MYLCGENAFLYRLGMQTRISHILFMCLLLLAIPLTMVVADEPDAPDNPPFPPDPGNLYVPPVVIIMGDTITPDPGDTTAVIPEVIDVSPDGDSTMTYNTVENTLTLNNVEIESASDTLTTIISYTGTDTLTIILQDSSTLVADTIISSQSDIVIKGDGHLVAEGDVPIIGVPSANITFDSVNMTVRSLPGHAAVCRRVRGGKRLDETGGPALSGFGSTDFNKVEVSPSDAMYGPINTGGEGEEQEWVNALYVENEYGEKDYLTEFTLTARAGDDDTAVRDIKQYRSLDTTAPMYNILGLPVDASYRGIVIQAGHTYLLH